MAHIQVALSERTFVTALELLRGNFRIRHVSSRDLGTYTATLDLDAHLTGGEIGIRDDGLVQLKQLDLRWDRLSVSLDIPIPELCVGGGCVTIPGPLTSMICFPQVCAFSDDPVITVAIDLAPYVAQELSVSGRVDVRRWDPDAIEPGFDPCKPLVDLLDADALADLVADQPLLAEAGIFAPFPTDRRQWHVHLVPGPIDLDLIDLPDIVGDLLEKQIAEAVGQLLPTGWARNVILGAIGDMAEFSRWLLDIPDSTEEWLMDLLDVSFGLHDSIMHAVGAYLGECLPLLRLEDPFEIMPEQEGDDAHIAVLVPLEHVEVSANDDELILSITIGAPE